MHKQRSSLLSQCWAKRKPQRWDWYFSLSGVKAEQAPREGNHPHRACARAGPERPSQELSGAQMKPGSPGSFCHMEQRAAPAAPLATRGTCFPAAQGKWGLTSAHCPRCFRCLKSNGGHSSHLLLLSSSPGPSRKRTQRACSDRFVERQNKALVSFSHKILKHSTPCSSLHFRTPTVISSQHEN